MQNGEEFLFLIKEVIDDIIASPRWNDNDTPMPGGFKELWEKINNGNSYKSIRDNSNLTLLLEILESYEEALNDDWMPFEILELKPNLALLFIKKVREIIESYNIDDYNIVIKKAYWQIKE